MANIKIDGHIWDLIVEHYAGIDHPHGGMLPAHPRNPARPP